MHQKQLWLTSFDPMFCSGGAIVLVTSVAAFKPSVKLHQSLFSNLLDFLVNTVAHYFTSYLLPISLPFWRFNDTRRSWAPIRSARLRWWRWTRFCRSSWDLATSASTQSHRASSRPSWAPRWVIRAANELNERLRGQTSQRRLSSCVLVFSCCRHQLLYNIQHIIHYTYIINIFNCITIISSKSHRYSV